MLMDPSMSVRSIFARERLATAQGLTLWELPLKYDKAIDATDNMEAFVVGGDSAYAHYAINRCLPARSNFPPEKNRTLQAAPWSDSNAQNTSGAQRPARSASTHNPNDL